MTGYDLVRVTWVDAHNNQGAWMTRDELAEFARDEAYRVTQVGYKVHEDELCIVLAARLSTPSADYGQSFGMCERIPRKLIDSETLIQSADGGPFRIGWRDGGLIDDVPEEEWRTAERTSDGATLIQVNPCATPS